MYVGFGRYDNFLLMKIIQWVVDMKSLSIHDSYASIKHCL